MNLIVSQFLLLSLALTVRGQILECWYLPCTETLYQSQPIKAEVDYMNYYNQQPIMNYNGIKVENTQGQSGMWMVDQKQEAPKVNAVQQSYVPTMQNFLLSQQPSQSQAGIWMVNHQIGQTQEAPKVNTVQQSYTPMVQSFVHSQQPIQSQGGNVMVNQKPEATQQPLVHNVVYSQQPQSQSGAWIMSQQPSQSQGAAWIVSQQPSQSQGGAWIVSQQPSQSQGGAWIASQQAKTPQVDASQYAYQSNLLNYQQSSQSQTGAWAVNLESSFSNPKTYEYYYQTPEQFLVNYVSYPIQPSESQGAKVEGTQQTSQKPDASVNSLAANSAVNTLADNSAVNIHALNSAVNTHAQNSAVNIDAQSTAANTVQTGPILAQPVVSHSGTVNSVQTGPAVPNAPVHHAPNGQIMTNTVTENKEHSAEKLETPVHTLVSGGIQGEPSHSLTSSVNGSPNVESHVSGVVTDAPLPTSSQETPKENEETAIPRAK